VTAHKRAATLFKTATKDYAKNKRAAEKAVTTWQWATRETTDVHPTWFATLTQGRGKKLPKKPTKANYQAHEGFDAEGRVVVQRAFTNSWDNPYEKFITYAPDEIVAIRYVAPHVQTVMVLTPDEDGRVTSIEWVSDHGHTTITYTFDKRGFYASHRESGGARDGTAFDFDCDDKGKIVRTWWVYPDGKRVHYKGKK
jgi:hypothetical protein